MFIFRKEHLENTDYVWPLSASYCPVIKRFPNRNILDPKKGPEMLSLINVYINSFVVYGLVDDEAKIKMGRRIEREMRNNIPPEIRVCKDVESWISRKVRFRV